jgi:hypothetical protein
MMGDASAGGARCADGGSDAAATSPATTAVTSSATVPPTTSPATVTTLPSGARELFSYDELRVGVCIYRAPGAAGQNDLERRSFEVDCSQPHHVELFHRFEPDVGGAADYPGDGVLIAQSEPVCELAFAAYIGVPVQQSRLRYVVIYPLEPEWLQGEREVFCFVAAPAFDELRDRPMRGSRVTVEMTAAGGTPARRFPGAGIDPPQHPHRIEIR